VIVIRAFDVIAAILFLAGVGGSALALYFLWTQRFIEGVIAGLLSFILLRVGLLILRLMVARSCVRDAHERVLRHLGGNRP
jgi:hypothetical protein